MRVLKYTGKLEMEEANSNLSSNFIDFGWTMFIWKHIEFLADFIDTASKRLSLFLKKVIKKMKVVQMINIRYRV